MAETRRRLPRPTPSRPVWRRLIDYFLAALFLFLLMVLVVRLEGASRVPQAGVAIITDGDSITLGGVRVRLRGIDAPEYTQTCQRGGASYRCGLEARDSLRKLIGSRAVSCTSSGEDRYGRLLGDCRTSLVDLNAGQVAAGWAVAYGGYESEEAEARKKRLGIWQGEFEQPSQWRTQHKETYEPPHDFLAMLGDRIRRWFSSQWNGA